MASRREKTYDRMLQDLIDKVGKLTDVEVGKVLDLLRSLEKGLALRLIQTEWDQFVVPQLREAVSQAVQAVEQQWAAIQSDAAINQWAAGIDLIDGPLSAGGVRISAPELSRTQLSILQGYSADLIKGVSQDAIKRINQEISMGLLGGQSNTEAMKAIERILGIKEDKGIAYRAERIVRTESARVNSAARQARIDSLLNAEIDPPVQLFKKWIHSGKYHARPTHAARDGKIVPIDEKFGSIPYPHAPGLKAEDVVNCGCTHVVTCDWDKLPKSFEPAKYQPRAIYS